MENSEQKPLRHAVIGVGALVFSMHAPALEAAAAQVVGVCDINIETGKPRADALGCPFYTNYRQMLAETHPDVVSITTPHYLHAQMAIDSLHAGAHVLVEKPMALQVTEADAMVEAVAETGRLLAVNFQHRHRPEVVAAHRLIENGRLGKLQRIKMISPWPRTERYYGMASWRATWPGEGGGVLMNQAPHDLDLVCHLLGAPARVVAFTRTNVHRIEVEDTASAMLEWANGATGYLYVSTAEAGPRDDIEIVGTGGILKIGQGHLAFDEFESDVHEFLLNTDEIWRGPALHSVPVELGEGAGTHVDVYRDLYAAIREGRQPRANATEGRMSLELANAIIYSSRMRAPVELPLDRPRYAALLAELTGGRSFV